MTKNNLVSSSSVKSDHYVYVYRDEKSKVRYVGYGKGTDRPTSLAHGEAFVAFIKRGKYTLEVAGPYGSKDTGLAVETALIGSLRPDLNSTKAPGPKRWQFRPLGVPERYAKRLSEPPLTRKDFTSNGIGGRGPIIFVRIGSQNFDDRKGYSLSEPPSDEEILARMEAWWQLGPSVDKWIANPERSPRALVCVTGPPTHRIIVAAVAIDRKGWKKTPPETGKLYKVPTPSEPNLDWGHLRGRLLSPEANIKFGAIRPHFFVILRSDGITERERASGTKGG